VVNECTEAWERAEGRECNIILERTVALEGIEPPE